MKLIRIFIIILITLSVSVTAQTKKAAAAKPAAEAEIKTQNDSISYAIGQNIFNQLKDLGLNLDILTQSIKDASMNKSTLTQENCMRVLTVFQAKMQEAQAAKQAEEEAAKKEEMAPLIEKNKLEGAAFLDENKKKEGVITTASGLQYKVITQGTGETPKATDQVTVHYKGTLISGEEFDSSYKRNEPATFPLNQVIKGWTEGLQLMNVGSKYEFYIPYELAYGEMGRGTTIPPASVLIFEVELLGIVK